MKYIEIDGVPQPCDNDNIEEWTRALESNRLVKQETIGNIFVSTVFLGVNHQFGDGPPLVYETMTFGNDALSICERYSTRPEAIAGHAEVAEQVKQFLGEDTSC